jgi:hypothetical protein
MLGFGAVAASAAKLVLVNPSEIASAIIQHELAT